MEEKRSFISWLNNPKSTNVKIESKLIRYTGSISGNLFSCVIIDDNFNDPMISVHYPILEKNGLSREDIRKLIVQKCKQK